MGGIEFLAVSPGDTAAGQGVPAGIPDIKAGTSSSMIMLIPSRRGKDPGKEKLFTAGQVHSKSQR